MRPEPDFTLARQRSTGADAVFDVVKTPAAVVPSGRRMTSTSSRPLYLMPVAAVPRSTPSRPGNLTNFFGAKGETGLATFLALTGFFEGFLAAGFFAGAFLTIAFLATGFFLATAFLAVAFFANGFFTAVFLAGAFLATDFLADTFLAAGFFFAAAFLAAGFFAAIFLASAFLVVAFFLDFTGCAPAGRKRAML